MGEVDVQEDVEMKKEAANESPEAAKKAVC